MSMTESTLTTPHIATRAIIDDTTNHPKTVSVPEWEDAIKARVAQLEQLGVEHQDYSYLLAHLSILWLEKAQHTRERDDSIQAIIVARRAVSMMLPSETDVPFIVAQLCRLLFREVKTFGREEDMVELLYHSSRALEEAEIYTAKWVQLRYNHNSYIFEQWKQFGNSRLLDDIIEHACLLIDIRTDNQTEPTMPRLLSQYSMALCERGKSIGSLPDLDQGIALGFRSVKICSASDSDYASIVNDLVYCLKIYYEMTLLSDSLDEGTMLVKRALETVSGQGPSRPLLLKNYGAFLFLRSERCRDSDPALSLSLLEDAICQAREALECHEREWELDLIIQCTNSLSAWLGLKLKLDGDVESGLESVQLAETALMLTAGGYRDKSGVLNNLLCTLDALYGALRSTDYEAALRHLEYGIRVGEEAVNGSDCDDMRHGERILNLASMYAKSYNETDSEEEFQRAKSLWLSASSCQSARPAIRIAAGLKAGQACFADSDFEGAHQVLASSIDVLRKLSLRSISMVDRRYLLSQIAGIAPLAAAATLQAGKSPYEALTSLETARCVTSRLSIDMKDDIPELARLHPTLYQQYDSLRQSFSSSHTEIQNSDYVNRVSISKKISDGLNDLENQIRQQEGFERFQLPPSEDELMALAEHGPIVTYNVVRYRSDALVVTPDSITVVPLTGLRYDDLESKIKTFSKLCFSSRLRKTVPRRSTTTQHDIASILQWLWDIAVKPVLNKIKLTQTRRVWWMTSGLMSLAPIHAAGNHAKGSLDNTMSHVISSYISSFKALSHARRPRSQIPTSRRVLLVTMPNTPTHQELNVQAEKQAIHTTFGNYVTEKEQATCDDVLVQMPHHSILHLACHGYLSPSNPSESGLVLMRGEEAEILPITKIERVTIPDAELAYLSACSTAELTFDKHIDEAINMANCFQILGFRHVIGTMWSASDRSAGIVAQKFYTRLAERLSLATAMEFRPQLDTEVQLNAAKILHHALCEYKDECGDASQLAHWIPYIHVGK